jgi:hypothetical protein
VFPGRSAAISLFVVVELPRRGLQVSRRIPGDGFAVAVLAEVGAPDREA